MIVDRTTDPNHHSGAAMTIQLVDRKNDVLINEARVRPIRVETNGTRSRTNAGISRSAAAMTRAVETVRAIPSNGRAARLTTDPKAGHTRSGGRSTGAVATSAMTVRVPSDHFPRAETTARVPSDLSLHAETIGRVPNDLSRRAETIGQAEGDAPHVHSDRSEPAAAVRRSGQADHREAVRRNAPSAGISGNSAFPGQQPRFYVWMCHKLGKADPPDRRPDGDSEMIQDGHRCLHSRRRKIREIRSLL